MLLEQQNGQKELFQILLRAIKSYGEMSGQIVDSQISNLMK